jgi:hypothetical protein
MVHILTDSFRMIFPSALHWKATPGPFGVRAIVQPDVVPGLLQGEIANGGAHPQSAIGHNGVAGLDAGGTDELPDALWRGEDGLLRTDEVTPHKIDRPRDMARLAIAVLLTGILFPTPEIDEFKI